MVCDLGREIRQEMLLEIARREAKAATKGENPAKEDPIGLVVKSAQIVLNDHKNEEHYRAMREGRTMINKRFDPSRDQGRGRDDASKNNKGPVKWQDTT